MTKGVRHAERGLYGPRTAAMNLTRSPKPDPYCYIGDAEQLRLALQHKETCDLMKRIVGTVKAIMLMILAGLFAHAAGEFEATTSTQQERSTEKVKGRPETKGEAAPGTTLAPAK